MSINRIEKLAYRCYKILPLVYDESLSYYEVICKCAEKLNEVIDTLDSMTDSFNQWDEIISGLDTELTEIQNAIDALEEWTETEGATIDSAVSDIATLQTNVTNLSNRLLPVESGLAALRISTAQDIADVNSRCTQAEVRIGLVENGKLDKSNPTGTGALSMNRKANTAVGSNSATLGNSNEAQGGNAVAEGYNNKANAANSHVEGQNNTITSTGNGSHVEGDNNAASGSRSHVEGANNSVSANNAHAEGYNNTVSAGNAHAEGQDNTAAGLMSHVEGKGNLADGECQHVAGKYNKANSAALRITGNGSANTEAGRSNAEMLDASGNLRLAGNVYVGCNPDSTGGTAVGGSVIYKHHIELTITGNPLSKGTATIWCDLFMHKGTAFSDKTDILQLIEYCTCQGYFQTSLEPIIYFSCSSDTLTFGWIDKTSGEFGNQMVQHTITANEISDYITQMPA